MNAPNARALMRTSAAASPLVALLCFLAAIWYGSVPLGWALGIEGNTYTANFVLAVATVCGQAVIFINLAFYLYDIRPAGPATRGDAAARAEMNVIYAVLLICSLAAFVYFVYAAAALLGVRRPGWSIFQLEFFGNAARVTTVLMFALFMVIDIKLAHFWSGHLDALASQGNEDARRRAATSMEFAKMSVWLIDLPAIVVTVGSWLLMKIMSTAAFMAHRLDHTYVSEVRWTKMQQSDLELFFHGLDSGVVIAAMLISQGVFMWLMWRYRDGEA